MAKQEERIKELEENQVELHKLRSLMFELQNHNDPIEENEIDYSKELLTISNDKKIICIGGHIRLLYALKSKYPNRIFMSNESNVSSRGFNGADHIFFFYNFLSHGLYYKIMSMLNQKDKINWDYISSRNIDLVEKDIFDKITFKTN